MVKTILDNTNFVTTPEKSLKLKNGIPTGSSFSVALANMRLDAFEEKIIRHNKI